MISNAEAIRQVCRDDISITNDEIKYRCKRLHGCVVETNQIIEVVGAYKDRRHKGPAARTLQDETKKYLKMVGSKRFAIQLIHLAVL